MPEKSHGERLDRLDQVVNILAERHFALEEVVAELATETRRGFDQVAAQFKEMNERMDEERRRTDEQFRETDQRMRQLAEEGAQRSRELDERVDKLVLAIGEFIRQQNTPRA